LANSKRNAMISVGVQYVVWWIYMDLDTPLWGPHQRRHSAMGEFHVYSVLLRWREPKSIYSQTGWGHRRICDPPGVYKTWSSDGLLWAWPNNFRCPITPMSTYV